MAVHDDPPGSESVLVQALGTQSHVAPESKATILKLLISAAIRICAAALWTRGRRRIIYGFGFGILFGPVALDLVDSMYGQASISRSFPLQSRDRIPPFRDSYHVFEYTGFAHEKLIAIHDRAARTIEASPFLIGRGELRPVGTWAPSKLMNEIEQRSFLMSKPLLESEGQPDEVVLTKIGWPLTSGWALEFVPRLALEIEAPREVRIRSWIGEITNRGVAGLLLATILVLPSFYVGVFRIAAGRCDQCGYPLRPSASKSCPECGKPVLVSDGQPELKTGSPPS